MVCPNGDSHSFLDSAGDGNALITSAIAPTVAAAPTVECSCVCSLPYCSPAKLNAAALNGVPFFFKNFFRQNRFLMAREETDQFEGIKSNKIKYISDLANSEYALVLPEERNLM